MTVEEKLSEKKMLVENELELILSQEDTILFQAMRYAVLSGGKRFRPLLTLSSGECFGASYDVLLPFACAIELIHNYSLVHDDLPLLDDDDYRRGKPTCHKVYGEDLALLAGDSLLTLAFEVLASAYLEKDFWLNKERVIREISLLVGAKGMIGGQFMDITLSREELTEESFFELITKKTGALIVASVKTGAILGNANDTGLRAIMDYGRNVGLAFQIRDDIIDLGREEKKNILRPNFASLFGRENAERKLRGFVRAAHKALDVGSLESEGLRYLASKLLEF